MNNSHSTLCHVAIACEAYDVLDFLIRNTSPESWLLKDDEGDSILSMCVYDNAALQILQKYGCTRFCKPNEIPWRFTDSVTHHELLSLNADIDEEDKISGDTTLHVAAHLVFDADFFKIFLSRHLNKMTRENKYGKTPLYIAICYENEAACSILMRALTFEDLYKTFTTTFFHTQQLVKDILNKKFQNLKQFLFDLDLSFVGTTDVLLIVYDYLGFENKHKNKHKKKIKLNVSLFLQNDDF